MIATGLAWLIIAWVTTFRPRYNVYIPGVLCIGAGLVVLAWRHMP